MICNNCGMSFNETAKFCSGCGESTTTTADTGDLAMRPAPVSLFTEPTHQQSAAAVVCVIHPNTVASGACVGCGNFHCGACLVNHGGRNYCRNCSTRLSGPLSTGPQSQQLEPYRFQQTNAPYAFQQPPPQQIPYQYQVPVNPYVRRKEPAVALLLSFFLPGVGQIYNGDVGKGIAFLIGFWVLIWVGIGIVFWIWAMVDAYQVATQINLGRRV